MKGSTLDLVYYNNLLSAAVVGPTVLLSGEWVTVVEMFAAGGKSLQTFLIGAVVTVGLGSRSAPFHRRLACRVLTSLVNVCEQGVFGFLICIAGFLSIKVTSPVSHMISSAVRGVIQTFLGMWLFGDIITRWVVIISVGQSICRRMSFSDVLMYGRVAAELRVSLSSSEARSSTPGQRTKNPERPKPPQQHPRLRLPRRTTTPLNV